MIRSKRLRLLVGLVALLSCGTTPPPPGGLLAGPEGISLANSLLLVANGQGNEVKAFDTVLREFIPAPNVLLPLSIPTVTNPGPLCSDTVQAFVTSTVYPSLGILDVTNDESNNDPPTGLRELGEVTLPGIASALICAKDPAQVTQRKIAVSGNPATYRSQAAAQDLPNPIDVPDGSLPDGALDERTALSVLNTVALMAINTGPESPTQIYQVGNDITGETCGGAGCQLFDGGFCPAFCPITTPLLTLPPQPASCQPIGPPLAISIDVAGGGAGVLNLGVPNIDPYTVNLMMAADRNSNCVADIDLDDLSVTWIDSMRATSGIYAMPYYPGACVAGGLLFAAALDSEACERQGVPPPGGYDNCNGLLFYNPALKQRIPEPLPYPFVPRRPEPPVRIPGILGQVQSLAYTGYGMQVGYFSADLVGTVPFQFFAIPGTAVGDLVYVDLGPGFPCSADGGCEGGGGTLPVDGGFPCPPAYFAPRLVDQNDYIADPLLPSVITIRVTDGNGLDLGIPSLVGLGQPFYQPLTADGQALPPNDRVGNPFPTPIGPDGNVIQAVNCYALVSGLTGVAEMCITDGLMQHGVVEDELFSVAYEGTISGLSQIDGTLNGTTLQAQLPDGGLDLTTTIDGLLVRETPNLTVLMSQGGLLPCGTYGITAVAPSSLTVQPGPLASCTPGAVNFSVIASGAKPYTVTGSASGFIPQLWPKDGTLQLVTHQRWQYPANLIGMLQSAQQLSDLTFGLPPGSPVSPAPNSVVPYPRDGGLDYAALDSPFALAIYGVLGPLDGGVLPGEDGGTADGGTVSPLIGASYVFATTSGVAPVSVNPQDISALITGMASYTDPGGGRHVYAAYQGGSALVELNPIFAYFQYLLEVH